MQEFYQSEDRGKKIVTSEEYIQISVIDLD